MSKYNNMRVYRKSAQLIQADVAYISAMPDYSNISRMESGQKEPSIEMLIVYNLLFEMPIDNLFGELVGTVRDTVIERINSRVETLKAMPVDPKVSARISFLESALSRLVLSATV